MRYEVDLAYQVDVAGADFIFNVQPARTRQQSIVQESLTVSQNLAIQEFTDSRSDGRFLRFRAFAGPLQLLCSATVDIVHHRQDPATIDEAWVPSVPGEWLQFLYPSRYCESDKLIQFATAQFGNLWQGYSRVQAICEWVNRHVQFVSGSSTGTTSAVETLQQKQGVCRDFAHLMIALCRAVNIPARFTTGLDYGADPALGPPDFHAYVEAYVGNRWYLFDPSGTAIPMGFVRLTSGRDAADSAFATIFGSVTPLHSRLDIRPLAGADGVLREPYRAWDGLSTDDGWRPWAPIPPQS